MTRPPKPRCGFLPACDMTVSVHVPTIRTGVPCCGLSLSRKGQVLSRLNIFGMVQACAEPARETRAKASAKQIAFIVLEVMFIMLYIATSYVTVFHYLPL